MQTAVYFLFFVQICLHFIGRCPILGDRMHCSTVLLFKTPGTFCRGASDRFIAYTCDGVFGCREVGSIDRSELRTCRVRTAHAEAGIAYRRELHSIL
jgi:hypothetical protein